MNSAYNMLLRLKAFQQGKALPRGETRHFPIADDDKTLVVAFVRMGGESSPWGVAFGRPGGRPRVLTVPEPRNRDSVADMVSEFAPTLLEHLFQPEHSSLSIEGPKHPRPLRQLWLPNQTHLEMLHYLCYAYTFTKWGAAERVRLLNALGRAAGWLFREGQRPGQVFVMIGTEALRESFVFPAEDTRQGHLGYLMAWLEAKGGREARLQAASEAERLSIATNLAPEIERDRLEPLVEAYNQARSSGDDKAARSKAREIHRVLEPELRRRFDLTVEARGLLAADKRRTNTGVDVLIKAANEEHWYQFIRLEQARAEEDDGPAFTPSPETDRHPAAAASRYYVHEASAELRDSILLHDDLELQAEAVARGEAFRGRIVRVDDEGERKTIPVWSVETEGDLSLKLREGSDVCVAALPNRRGRIRRIDAAGEGKMLFEVEITGLKTAAKGYPGLKAANDPALKGRAVVLVAVSHDGIPRMKSRRVWASGGPGAWLTHLIPKGSQAELPPDVGEDLTAIDAALREKA